MSKTEETKNQREESTPHLISSPERKGFRKYLAEKRNEIIAATIVFIITVVVIGTVLGVGQEWIKKKILSEGTSVDLNLINSAIALFPDSNSFEVVQILTYELSASDLVRQLKVTAIFGQLTKVVRCNVVYSVDVSGFKSNLPQKNYITLSLDHNLDLTKRARIYILTERSVPSSQNVAVELPNIHVQGEDKNGKTVYL